MLQELVEIQLDSIPTVKLIQEYLVRLNYFTDMD